MGDETILDTRGLKCPLPVLKARKRLKSMAKGETLRVHADDPVAVVDFPHFCNEQGYKLISVEAQDGGSDLYIIQK